MSCRRESFSRSAPFPLKSAAPYPLCERCRTAETLQMVDFCAPSPEPRYRIRKACGSSDSPAVASPGTGARTLHRATQVTPVKCAGVPRLPTAPSPEPTPNSGTHGQGVVHSDAPTGEFVGWRAPCSTSSVRLATHAPSGFTVSRPNLFLQPEVRSPRRHSGRHLREAACGAVRHPARLATQGHPGPFMKR
jgi:hypothetical protein